MKRISAFLLTLFGCIVLNAGNLRTAKVLGSNMVLQQNSSTAVWGWAEAGAKVTVRADWLPKKETRASCDADGAWSVEIPTGSADFVPHRIEVVSGREKIVFDNVLFGEVWICGGQSNMGMPLLGYHTNPVEGFLEEEFAAAAGLLPEIRYAQVAPNSSLEVMDDVKSMNTGGDWQTFGNSDIRWWCAVPYFFAKYVGSAIKVPIGLLVSCMGSTTIEAWMSREDLQQFDDVSGYEFIGVQNPTEYQWTTRPYTMYNAMIPAIAPYSARGFLWYQGEGNTYNPSSYADKMKVMVECWRTLWNNADMPFYYVEIAPLKYGGFEGMEAALLREAQFKAQSIIPHSGMVSTNDLPDDYEKECWHPKRKREIGQRLAMLALARDYGKNNFNFFSPFYKFSVVNGSEMEITFETGDGYLAFSGIPRGFEIAGEDGVFYYTEDVVLKGPNKITVKSDKVSHPEYVRYAFHNWCPGSMCSETMLPVIPFRNYE